MSNFAKRLTQLSQGRRFVLLKETPQLYEHFRCYPFWEDFKEKAQLERLKMGIIDDFVLPLEEWTEEHYWSLILNLDLTEIQDLPSRFYEDAGVFQSNERRLVFGSLLVGYKVSARKPRGLAPWMNRTFYYDFVKFSVYLNKNTI